MKKLVIIFVILCLFGCSKKEEIEEKEPVEVPVVEEEKYVDDNPIVVGLYENDYSLVKDFYAYKTGNQDLIFSVYFTNDPVLPNRNQKNNWYNNYNKYSDISKYKIGFNISFYAGDEYISRNVLEPEEYLFNPYFYIYLYDDIHQVDGAWYSHIEQVTDETIFSSIKLYLVEPSGITSPIKLTVFTYDSDDFDESGNYRGNSKYEMNINWK